MTLLPLSDVSWGTKGDNTVVKTDLGVVAPSKNNNVEVVVPTEDKDINAAYEDAIAVLNRWPPLSMCSDEVFILIRTL